MAQQRLSEIRAARLAKREALLAAGQVPYPSEARRTHRAADFQAQFAALAADHTTITVAGRVTALRHHGRLAFIDVTDPTGTVQLQLNAEDVPEELFGHLAYLDAGDFVQAAGQAGMSARGTPTLVVLEWHLLGKSIRPLPSAHFGLKDVELRLRQREVDLLLNSAASSVLQLRSRIITWLRERLAADGYFEAETPILQTVAGGALAQPFTTHHQTLDLDLYLRIAPELYLKRLLVGGFEKVFELGRVFRNEGTDRDHNPEFTMCELYWAYADYEDLMDYSEHLLNDLAQAVLEKNSDSEKRELFSPPWQRLRFTDALSENVGFDVLEEQGAERYVAEHEARGLPLPASRTYSKLLDSLYKELVRPQLTAPTILYDYPAATAPLAKRSTLDRRLAERFQVVVGGIELVNAYTELNDPVEQRERFAEQGRLRAAGDVEAAQADEAFLTALEFGMPPAAGWGLGIDRLVALLAGCSSIKETIAFPLLKP